MLLLKLVVVLVLAQLSMCAAVAVVWVVSVASRPLMLRLLQGPCRRGPCGGGGGGTGRPIVESCWGTVSSWRTCCASVDVRRGRGALWPAVVRGRREKQGDSRGLQWWMPVAGRECDGDRDAGLCRTGVARLARRRADVSVGGRSTARRVGVGHGGDDGMRWEAGEGEGRWAQRILWLSATVWSRMLLPVRLSVLRWATRCWDCAPGSSSLWGAWRGAGRRMCWFDATSAASVV